MTPLRVLLADEHPDARRSISSLLKQNPNISIAGEAGNADQLLKLANDQQPELIFTNTRLGAVDTFGILSQLSYRPQVVFVSSNSEDAVQAFEVGALDYLLKPVHSERLAITLNRLSGIRTAVSGGSLLLRDGRQTYCIHKAALCAVTADGNFTSVHQCSGVPLFVRKSIGEWEELLGDENFLRLNRSLIVNVNKIQRIERLSRDEARLFIHNHKDPFILRRTSLLRLRKLGLEE